MVFISTIVTKLNSQLPDATVTIDNVEKSCNSRTIDVDYTVRNFNSTEILPVINVAIYAGDSYLTMVQTTAPIAIGGSESGSVTLIIPDEIPNEFELRFVADRNQIGVGFVAEIDENNNTNAEIISLIVSPPFNLVPPLVACNEGLLQGTFDFSSYETQIKNNPGDTVTFYNSQQDASAEVNPITNSDNFNTITPKEIFARIETPEGCFNTTSFMLTVKNCPPKIYNLVAPFTDNFYDTFLIDGLRDIFVNFRLNIYNRWGDEVWTGNNNTADWDGKATKGFRMSGSDLPEGTYFYILELNDPDFPEPMNGFLYLKR
ncbi:gliding motility-associated C-terminal domain-containing protein [Flavobacterium sp. 3HN19-14]|uniref:gliding motility-associated C-terminal domain-containing protein n=1 Tax=Flavobacterium sp. 3HN19-14 TaxID=3448133 RepID=UPI003EDF2AC6